MKAFTVVVLSLFLIAGLVGAVGAQSDAQKAPDVKIEVKPPDVKVPDVKIEGKVETKDESPSATPRTDPGGGGGGGRIFGVNSTVAVVAGAVFVFVVILALVAMTRRIT